MALRDQPYLPLYVQDVLTDEKLIECSASAHGVYFRLMCLLHKQETYGLLCLKQKYKQNESKLICFADMLCKQMPFSQQIIHDSLIELIEEDVIQIDGDCIIQKRMLKDGKLSIIRTDSGKKGGSNVTKQYGKAGFLYLMSDGFDKNKIGISINPANRLYRLRCDLKLPKHFEIKEQVQVKDMGKSEDFAQLFFKDILDGEWLKSNYETVFKKFALLKAKIQAKPKANTENDIEIKNEIEFELPIEKEETRTIYQIAIDDFSEMRKFIKKPLTGRALSMIKTKANQLANGDEEITIAILNQSTICNWQDVFLLKKDKNIINEELKNSKAMAAINSHDNFLQRYDELAIK